MLGPRWLDRIARSLAMTSPLLIWGTLPAWAQSSGAVDAGRASPADWGSRASTGLAFIIVAAIVTAIIVVARYVAARRQRLKEAAVLQSQLGDAIAREALFRGLEIVPRARVSGWRRSQVTIEVAGEVPTPDLRETVMRVVQAEVWKLRPDVITVDHLFVAPPIHRAS
jgi:hypothetical protein